MELIHILETKFSQDGRETCDGCHKKLKFNSRIIFVKITGEQFHGVCFAKNLSDMSLELLSLISRREGFYWD